MSKADKMIYDLGFKYKKETKSYIEYTDTENWAGQERIKFELNKRRFVRDARSGQGNKAIRFIEMNELKAINTKVKELGWEE